MMKKTLFASAFVFATTAGYAASVTLDAGQSLMQQTKRIAANEGFTVLWKLDVDAPAREAAHSYGKWVDAIWGATKQISPVTAADKKIADLAAPVMCDDTKTIVITTFHDSIQIVKSESKCHALK